VVNALSLSTLANVLTGSSSHKSAVCFVLIIETSACLQTTQFYGGVDCVGSETLK